MRTEFNPAICERIGCYVYSLKDSRDGCIFYARMVKRVWFSNM